MDSWERFDETSFSDKKAFYSNLNIKAITDVDYRHAKRAFKEINIKIFGAYHNLYLQSGTLLLAGFFENFRNKCISIYELDPAHCISAPWLACHARLKMTGIKLELLTGNNLLTTVEKGIRGGIFNAIHKYTKEINKHMKNYDKNKESSCLMYLDVNIFL